jgi:hypothetical protein
MHLEALTPEQAKLLELIKYFKRDFGLAGGTAIALQMGHRKSVDFDLFSLQDFENSRIRKQITEHGFRIQNSIRDEDGQYTILVNGVQLTFLHYPFPIDFNKHLKDMISLPDLLTLAATKAYTLGRRPKWKDYVDLYFILKDHHSLQEVEEKGKNIFQNEFNAKMFRAQLSYFQDINYSEKIDYLPGFETDNDTIKKELTELSLQ